MPDAMKYSHGKKYSIAQNKPKNRFKPEERGCEFCSDFLHFADDVNNDVR